MASRLRPIGDFCSALESSYIEMAFLPIATGGISTGMTPCGGSRLDGRLSDFTGRFVAAKVRVPSHELPPTPTQQLHRCS